MATVYDTRYEARGPKEAWGIVSHLLENFLTLIGLLSEPKEGEGEDDRDRREKTFSYHRAQLVGYLYMIVRQMEKYGHADEADKIREILNMVTDKDVTDRAAREAILDKYWVLTPNTSP